ncbi:MAG: GNAT family N-acetyltransferase [Prevotellaceae bacterium]|nr:GNAT family N-acetyltransferase [Prevotellaceae bacterium]
MNPVIAPIERQLIEKELTRDKFVRSTSKGGNLLYEVTAHNAPNTMQEIGRLREISFRLSGGGTGKRVDIDTYDTCRDTPYKQLLVWDPKDREILGAYRYAVCSYQPVESLCTREIFNFSDHFTEEFLPIAIELGRSFVQPNYQSSNIRRKGLYALDNLWDGLGALIIRYPHVKYFFGKVTMYTSYHSGARNLLLNFLHKYFPDLDQLVIPKKPLEYDKNNPYYSALFQTGSYKEDYKALSQEIRAIGESIPPLINSYMSLSPSMRVFGTSVNEHFGGVEETGILVSIEDIYPSKIDRHIAPIRLWKDRLRMRWWRNQNSKRKRIRASGRRLPPLTPPQSDTEASR